ncbi:hypothetical protein [Sphingorhabdus sp.]|jgi:hypothetical protein|uniref:hypothetical protein n=1 Tax=Sphingorhabdus sp. TaxID=1902408 RepID=UPI0037CC462E
MHFYGLLYFGGNSELYANLKVPGGIDPRDIYIENAVLCRASLAHFGIPFTVITNDIAAIQRRMEILGIEDLDVREQSFTLQVPIGISFYSAHFKIELIEAFGTGVYGDYVGLIDLDTVLCRPFDPLPRKGLSVYDISEQVLPAYGINRVFDDLACIAGRKLVNPRWYGGEFISGDAASFYHLSRYIKECWPRYVNAIGSLHHLGDEAVVSAALNVMAEDEGRDHRLSDDPGGVCRWWSIRTKHPQARLEAVLNCSLLHLPADKQFLARLSRVPFAPDRFRAALKRHVRARMLPQTLMWISDILRGKPPTWMPRM